MADNKSSGEPVPNEPLTNEPIEPIGNILDDSDQFLAITLAMNRYRSKMISMLDNATEHDRIAWYFALCTLIRDTNDFNGDIKVVADAYMDRWYALKAIYEANEKKK